MQAAAPEDRPLERRWTPNGLLVLLGIVVLGLATGAGYLAYKAPQLARERRAMLAQAATDDEGRLAQWLQFGGPQIHHRLARFARFSSECPWLVTHRVAAPDGGLPEVWGIDCGELPQDLARQEGMTIVVELPAPRPLGRVALDEAQSRYVPTYAAALDAGAAEARLIELATFFLEGLPRALAREIPGASLVIRVVSGGPAADQ